MMAKYKKPQGWRGNPQGHAMAARGVKLYAKKNAVLVDPVFFARKREEEVPTYEVMDAMRRGESFEQLRKKYPGADEGELRRKALRAVDSLEGSNIMSTMDSQGVDSLMHVAQNNREMRGRMEAALLDGSRRSLLSKPKAEILVDRLAQMR